MLVKEIRIDLIARFIYTRQLMKRTICTLLLGFCFAAVVHAGPEAISGKEMKQVAPAPVPACPDWSGFYVGGFGGYVRSNVDRSLKLTEGWIGFPTMADAERDGSRELDIDGVEAGGVIGYNFQFNHWVLGIEGSGAYLWARDSRVTHFVLSQSNFYRIATSFKTEYLATIGPRIGYAFCRWLPYVTGGAAFGNLDYTQAIIFEPDMSSSDREEGSKEESNIGWFAAGGLQYAITNRWSIRGQYQYVDLGDVSFRSDFGGGGGAPADQRAGLIEHHATVALIFGF